MQPDNNDQQPIDQHVYMPEHRKFFGKTFYLILGVLVLVVGFFFLGLYGSDIFNYFKKQKKNSSTNQVNVVVNNDVKQPVVETPTTTPVQDQNPNEIWLDVDWNKDVVKIECADSIDNVEKC